MPNVRRPLRGFAALMLSLVGLGVNPCAVRADDPVLINPTLQINPVPTTYHATQEQWDLTIAVLSSLYPNATYDDLETLALITYGLLPPVSSGTSTGTASGTGTSPSPITVPLLP
jgi:hypothetical protein